MPSVRIHFFVVALTIIGCAVNRPAPDETAFAAAPALTATETAVYIERITGGAALNERLPMVIAVHGLGDRPEDFQQLFDEMKQQVRVILPRAPKRYYRGYSWFDIELPMTSSAESSAPGIARAADEVASLAEKLSKSRPTLGRPIICGFSQGGAISFAAAARWPKLFGGAVPLSGSLPPSLRPRQKSVAFPKIRAAHGELDDLIPIDGAEKTISAFQKMDGDAALTVFVGVGHSLNHPMRDFLFAQIKALTSEKNSLP